MTPGTVDVLWIAEQNSSGINGSPCSLLHVVGFGEPDRVRLANGGTSLEHVNERQQTAEVFHLEDLAQHCGAKHGRKLPHRRWTTLGPDSVARRVACLTQSVPARVNSANWTGETLSTSSPNCLAKDFATSLWKEVPVAIPRTPISSPTAPLRTLRDQREHKGLSFLAPTQGDLDRTSKPQPRAIG